MSIVSLAVLVTFLMLLLFAIDPCMSVWRYSELCPVTLVPQSLVIRLFLALVETAVTTMLVFMCV